VDRLPLAWYKAQSQKLRDRARARGADAVLLQNDTNLVYFTGCFRGSGERTTWALLPVNETDTVYWFSPAIDRDLITSWWCTENDYYFCYPHAEGGFPNRGQLARGKRVDLWEWVLAKLAARGLGRKSIALDRELGPSAQRTWNRLLPSAHAIDISDECLAMQVIKTPEEIALTQRAYRYFDHIHAFARDYVLEHGTGTTDYQIGQALSSYGINLMMRDVKRDGKPHSAVGMDVTGNYVRTGVATAYPHPNQFHHNRIQKGQALQIAGGVEIGGCGGELYRAFLLAPWTDHQKKVWTVSRDSCLMQKDLSREGVACSTVAYQIHKFQVKEGMQKYIYHRPAHGMGMEGHQPPYLALGDYTMLEPGMVFSVEPGLYDPENGFGVNFSDGFVVQSGDKPSLQMSRLPWSEDWCLVKL
jgi:Xaa-Pro aminopeptidase